VTKASNNDFPSLLLTEQGSAPTTPAASHQRLYIRTSDHALVTVNSSGTVAAVGGGGGGGYLGTRTEFTLGADVSFVSANAFVDGTTAGVPTAGVYDVWARVTMKWGTSGNNYLCARLIANGSATPIDEAEEFKGQTNGSDFWISYLSARVTADGTNVIKVTAAVADVTSGASMIRDPTNNSSGIHRQCLLVLTRVS
jgi:hypothetical protein